MGTKRKASRKSMVAEGDNSGWIEKGGGMGPINSYEDVADSEDEFHITRDKIMLNEGPDAKRRRKINEEDSLLEVSDDEVLGIDSSSDEDIQIPDSEDEDDEARIQEEEDAAVGGYEKKEYYGADAIETEAQARAAEEEARRLQLKNLQKMSAADFGFDEEEWLDSGKEHGADKKDVVVEALAVQQITPDMSVDERMGIIQTRYPEYDLLADEAVRLQPVFVELQEQARMEKALKGSTARTITLMKCRALAAYLSCLAMYFAILTGPLRDDSNTQLLDPIELRDHPVIGSIQKCRALWGKAQGLEIPSHSDDESEIESEGDRKLEPQPIRILKKTKKRAALDATISKAALARQKRIEAAEAELSGLSRLMPKPRKSSKPSKVNVSREDEDNSDFGEEEVLSAKAAAEKAKKRKSLQFYTSQVVQKANKRAGAGREAGGDMDLPHKERLRDRQERLNREAEARGKKLDSYGRGAALGGESDEEDIATATEIRGEEDEYYDMVAKLSKKKKQAAVDKSAAIKHAQNENGLMRVVEGQVDADGKRAIGYVIEKNKGLAPKRKKEVRNPRVKKRMKYEEKKKKLSSMRATYKGGEERGGYGGEKTGIKSGLVKSVKL
ncbi:Sas10/Utp3 family protein-like protein [Calycina marina]|uniref:Sas10/Utp3 family protein-like protein n=1 Tax=Calycina marina TaxID=1763456 RepID=A0A9P8CC06_9HELO|nr:Sas10/Utp3 family protein-like protein [Calycina marina]